jgi:ABC-type multidrug transport system ATPase subunit
LAQSNSGILLSDVWKTYDGKNAVLHGVNLHVERGTVYGSYTSDLF